MVWLLQYDRYHWNSIQRWLKTSLEIGTTFTICEVIFGIQINNDDYTNLINYVILITKWYMNKNKEQENRLYFIELLSLFNPFVTKTVDPLTTPNYRSRLVGKKALRPSKWAQSQLKRMRNDWDIGVLSLQPTTSV